MTFHMIIKPKYCDLVFQCSVQGMAALCVIVLLWPGGALRGDEKGATSDSRPLADGSKLNELDAKISELSQASDRELTAGRFGEVERLTAEFMSLQSLRYGVESWRVRHSAILRDSYFRISKLSKDDQVCIRRALTMTQIGSRLADESKFTEASSILQAAATAFDDLVGPTDIHATDAKLRYAATLCDLGEVEKARAFALEVVTVREKLCGTDSLYYADAVKCLGEIYLKSGMLDPAEANLRLADQTYLRLFNGGYVFKRIVVLANLVVVLVKADKFADAEPLARQSIELAARKMNEHPKLYIQTRMYLAHCLHGKGDVKGAAREFAEVMSIVDRFEATPEYLIDVISRYVLILNAAGQSKDADRYRKRLSELKEQMAAEERSAGDSLPPPPE